MHLLVGNGVMAQEAKAAKDAAAAAAVAAAASAAAGQSAGECTAPPFFMHCVVITAQSHPWPDELLTRWCR